MGLYVDMGGFHVVNSIGVACKIIAERDAEDDEACGRQV